MIKINSPFITSDTIKNVNNVLKSEKLNSGPMVSEFEEKCAQMAGTSTAIAVANGSLALEVLLDAVGVERGDEVITTPFTYKTTIHSILRLGAKPRFADIGDDFNINPACIEPLINNKTKVIVPVHIFGYPCNMTAINNIAATHGLITIEDAAQAHGAKYLGNRVGGLSTGAIFSFYSTKNVSCGEGGAVTTNNQKVADRVTALTNAHYFEGWVGTNMRMSEVHATIGCQSILNLEDTVAIRNRHAILMNDYLGPHPQSSSLKLHAWNLYTIVPPVPRSVIIERMNKAKVETGIYYSNLINEDIEMGLMQDQTPLASDVSKRCLSLPIHQGLNTSDIKMIAEVYLDAIQNG